MDFLAFFLHGFRNICGMKPCGVIFCLRTISIVPILCFWTIQLSIVPNYWCYHCFLQRLSVTRALQRVFTISKTTFWWTSVKCFHDSSRVHFVSVSPPCSIVVGSGIIAQLLWQSNLQFRWHGGLACRENVVCLWITWQKNVLPAKRL